MADRPRILVVYGSVRAARQGIRAARFMLARLEARGIESSFADPLALQLPMLDKMYKEYAPGEAPANMETIAEMIRGADGVLIVSGEYNHGIPPALKNLLDHFLEEWFFRPAGICCYSGGRFGGVRAAMQLRMTLAELGMPTISSLLPVPSVQSAISKDGVAADERLVASADRFLDDLMWWVEAARARRAAIGTPF